MHRLKPRTIPELAACLALLRGPCISSGQDEVYMQIVEGKRDVTYIHPFYDSVTAGTLGILLYQEQIMQIAVNFGFSLEDGFKLMKAVAKKKIDKIKEYEEEFFLKADAADVPRECTQYIWQIILDAGLYCFNESHAIAYALLCYQSAYLKIHYPTNYMKNALTNVYERDKEIVETVKEAFRMGIKFESLDVNESDWDFKVVSESRIRIGMCAVKGLGKIAADEIVDKRPFNDLVDFCERITKNKCKKNNVIPAIFSGLFEVFGEDHTETYKRFCNIRKEEPLDVIEIKTMKMMFDTSWKMNKLETLFLRTQLMTNPSNGFATFDLDKQPRQFSCPAYIVKTKKKESANGTKNMFVDFSTGGGNLSAIIFGEKLQKGLRGGKLVNVTLRRNEDKYVVVNIA